MTGPGAADTLRAFVAIELPDDAKAYLAELVEALGRADVAGLRCVRPDAIHLTLKFLGDIPAVQVDAISDELTRTASSCEVFTLGLGTRGSFPNARRARVLWVGVDRNTEPLLRLHEAVEAGLERLGFAREERRFSPHVTLARLREETPQRAREAATAALLGAETSRERPTFQVTAVSLIRSTLTPTGAIYRRLARAPLRRAERPAESGGGVTC